VARIGPILSRMRRTPRRRIVVAALPLVALGAVAFTGGFADASDDLDLLEVGETHRTDRAEVTVRRAWVANFRPDEPRTSTDPKRRLFVEIDVTSHGYRTEDVIRGDGFGLGVAPLARIGGGEPRKFTSSLDSATWESRSAIHPGVAERLVLELEWPAGEPVPERVRLRLDDHRIDESNLLIDRVWVHTPDAYVDVPLGPAPPPVTR
jgi:hypothetical protein